MIDSLVHRRQRKLLPVKPADMIARISNVDPQPFTGSELRRWPAAYLYFAQRDGSGITAFNKAVVTAEVERRKAWDAPAAVSAVFAALALIVATLALVVTINRPPAASTSCPQVSR